MNIMDMGANNKQPAGERVLGVDTGGTFTDFVYYDGGRLHIHKVLSTPQQPERAILQGIEELGIDVEGLRLIHGSTVATNALLENKGARTAYITNRGLADVLTIGRQARERLYDLTPVPPQAPVPPELCLEVDARISAGGEVVTAPDTAELARLAQRLRELNVRAAAVNLVFSFVDSSHERQIAAALPDDVFVSCSSEVLPEYGEYERGIATWINASLGPLMADYLGRLAEALPGTSVAVMQSGGGTMAAAEAGRRAVHLLLSGPAGGLMGARAAGERADRRRLLSFDMGGTSTDVALIDGEIRLTGEGHIGRYPVSVPMVDMHTIGAGGGSIARVDAGGLLQVGPESAGASPGPACYGAGGSEATVTDANVVLGRLPATAALGGGLKLDVEAAEQAVGRLARQMDMDVPAAARGILKLANEHMAQALRVISVHRGIDIRDFTLMCFGGAGGLHVCALAELMNMRRALVPVHSGVLSALGMLVAPRQRLASRTLGVPVAGVEVQTVEQAFAELEHQARDELLREGVAAASLECRYSLDLRYRGQSSHLEIPWSADLAAVESAFHEAHRARYGHAMETPVELVNVRVQLLAPPPEVAIPEIEPIDADPLVDRAPVVGYADRVDCLRRDALRPAESVPGPVVIVEPIATTFVDNGWSARLDRVGNLLLERAAG